MPNLANLFQPLFLLTKRTLTGNNRKFKKKFNEALSALPLHQGITLVDVGAAGDIEPRWEKAQKFLHYVGFEPDRRSRDILNLNSQQTLSRTIRPEALGAENNNRVDFWLCQKPEVSSIYLPNKSFLSRFPNSKRFEVIRSDELIQKKLDDIGLVADFIKLDTQGSELDILMGSTLTLEKAFGIEVEVEFIELYKSQPLFGDVLTFLSSQGFEFIDFTNLCRWQRSAFDGIGQCVFGDALFFKAPEAVTESNLSNERIAIYLACLLVYFRFDLIFRTLELLSPEQRTVFNKFSTEIIFLQRRFEIVAKLNQVSRFFSSRLLSDTRNHLIY